MKTKLLLFLTILSLTLLIFQTQNTISKPYKIESIKTSQTLTTIKLFNTSTELIIFDNPNLLLQPNDTIKFHGKPSTYKSQKQIIATKIYKLNNQS